MRDETYTTPEGFQLSRRLLLPDARSFGDLFSDVAVIESLASQRTAAFPPREIETGSTAPRHRRRSNEVGPFCSVKAGNLRWYLDVVARDAVIDVVAPRIVTPDDALSFEIIEHARNGRALVLLQHNYILGSHWIAYIDPQTIPFNPSRREVTA